MSEQFKWPIQVTFVNGGKVKGYIFSSCRSFQDVVKELFDGHLHPFTLATKGGHGQVIVNTENVASICFYDNQYFKG